MLPRIEPQSPDFPPWEQIDIVIVGEAPGRDEVTAGIPFVGQAGKLLDEMLIAAGIDRSLCYVTNVFLLRPPNNKVAHFFVTPSEALQSNTPYCSELPAYGSNLYLRKEFYPELERLTGEISLIKPKAVIALGATAMWAFTGIGTGITKERGSMYSSNLVPSMIVFPTLHPAYVLRNRDSIETVVDDLKQVKQYINTH